MNAQKCRLLLKLGISPVCAICLWQQASADRRSRAAGIGRATQTLIAAAVLLPLAFSANSTLAQELKPVADRTLGAESSVVTPTSPQADRIDGGAIRGANLFHSFSQFNIGEGREAYFANPSGIENILSRVTGSDASRIFGKLGVLGNANLFLINPNGIIFGPNASLDVRGSFVASTASSLKFADGTEFSAKPAQGAALLTVSVPLGLQYGTNPGKIQVQGDGQGIRTTTELIDTTSGLRVPSNQTLALVGGDVSLEGATLKTAGGRIELGSVGDNSLVSLTPIKKGFALGYDGVQNFGNIQLSQQAAVDASGAGGGDIQVWSRRITLTNGSQIEASTLGVESGGVMVVKATELVEVIGTSAADDQIFSGLSAQAYPGATGNAGDLRINTRELLIQDGAQVVTGTFGSGKGGNLTVTADKVQLVGVGRSADGQIFGGLFAQAYPGATGNAGDLRINTGELLIQDGAQASTSTFGSGKGGNLTVTADKMQLVGFARSADNSFPSGLNASTGSTGDAGDLRINTGELLIQNGAQVSTDTLGSGKGGNLTVTANRVQLIGAGTKVNGQSFPSGLGTQARPGSSGDAGDLRINTGELLIQNGAQVSAGTLGSGKGGNLTVTANKVQLIGTGTFANGQPFPSLLSTSTYSGATGNAGDLRINASELLIQNGAQVSAGTFGSGKGGNLTVTANKVQLINRSGLSAQANPDSTGNAGDLTIKTQQLLVRDGAQVGAATFGAGNGGNLTVTADSIQLIGISADSRSLFPSGLIAGTQGTGKGGNLTITTQQLLISDGAITVSSRGEGVAGDLGITANSVRLDNGEITAQTLSGNGGNLKLNIADLLLLRRGSEISTTAGTAQQPGDGGNITINAPNGFIVAVPRENSDITANAFTGTGGRVDIKAFGIYGIQPRQNLTSLSDITASSEFGVNGTVQLNTPDIDVNSDLVNLPSVPIDTKLAQSCNSPNYAKSSFIITGRGGLPPNPKDILTPDAVQVDWVTLNPEIDKNSRTNISTNPNPTTPAPILEATGWVFGPKGEVIFTAQAPTQKQNSWQTPPKCHEK
ncbi:S-layer family protein [Brasilonema sp. CT11]|nr:S-layer family protein [Brasilonema sp. CT11]